MKTIDKQHFIRKFGVLNFVLFLVAMASNVQVVAQAYYDLCDPELKRKYDEEYLLGGLWSNIGPCGDGHLPDCIKMSDFIFEASVVKEEVVYGQNDSEETYTIMYLEVTKIFKGQINDTIALIMEGGYMGIPKKIGNHLTIPTSSSYPNLISFEKGFIGIFFGKSNEYQLLNPIAYQSFNLVRKCRVSYHSGMNKLNRREIDWTKNDPKAAKKQDYKEVQERFYKPIQNLVGKKMEVRREWFVVPKKGGAAQKEAAGSEFEIYDLIPDTVPAGFLDSTSLLTIVGTGFGNEKGNVQFKKEQGSGFFNAPSYHIRKWQDDTIQVWVPSVGKGTEEKFFAKTGYVRVKKVSFSFGNTIPSNDTLYIPYVVLSGKVKNTSTYRNARLLAGGPNPNGYAIIYGETLYNDSTALTTFRRALEKWRCASGVNIIEYCNTQNICEPPFTNLNGVIRVDFENECMTTEVRELSYRPFGIMDQDEGTRFYFSSENDTLLNFYYGTLTFTREYNLTDRDGNQLQWYYGTGNANLDTHVNFENTALHELGHFQHLRHCREATLMQGDLGRLGNDSQNITDITNDPARLGATQIVQRSSIPIGGESYPMVPVLPEDCALSICSADATDCSDPAYPIYALFSLTPENCVNDPNFNPNSDWQNFVSPYTAIILRDFSLGNNFINYDWDIQLDLNDFSNNEACDPFSDTDTCRIVYWSVPGEKTITLTATDANGCMSSWTEIVTVIDTSSCNTLAINTEVVHPKTLCDTQNTDCSTDYTGQITILPFSLETGSGCYGFYMEHLESAAIYTDNQLVFNDNDSYTFKCLPAGNYELIVTDEISGCENFAYIYLEANNTSSGNNTYTQKGSALNNGGGDRCIGTASVATLNDVDAATTYHHHFAWSDCSPPESCNTNVRENLCIGTYTVTVTDDLTGCSHTYDFNISYSNMFINVVLEGAVIAENTPDSILMNTYARQANLLPTEQPYEDYPWDYYGTESVADTSDIPQTAVDWILVEVRHEADTTQIAGRAAGFLLRDGNIIGADGSPLRILNLLESERYYVIVRHRNHLAISSRNSITLPNTEPTKYDFTASITQAKGNEQMRELPSGRYAMCAGDANADGMIDTKDYQIYLDESSSINDYLPSDFDINTHTTARDFNLMLGNNGAIGIDWIRYE